MKKQFTIAQILSVVSGILCCDISAIYDILNFMTGDNLYTHQLPRAGRWAKWEILKQHPFLTPFAEDGAATGASWRSRLDHVVRHHGETVEIKKPSEAYLSKNPIVELAEMRQKS